MPTGYTDIRWIAPAMALPLTPASTALAGTSTYVSPFASVVFSVVSKRTPPLVIATLPASIS